MLQQHCPDGLLMPMCMPIVEHLIASNLRLQVGALPLQLLLAMQVRVLSPCRVYPGSQV